MSRAILHRPLTEKRGLIWSGLILATALAFLLTGCGGGGGGGGSGTALSGGDGIALTSITFPKYTDLTGATKIPPSSAPLSQQVVFTFSGKVVGDVSKGGISISAKPGSNYIGPKAALDKIKNTLPARGTFEAMDNVVIFTPFIPTGTLDLTLNAKPENIPGLLPGFTYTVFIPVGTGGSIQNLVNIDPTVTNPIQFKTVSPDLPALFFGNVPALPPKVVATDPPDGSMDLPLNTFSGSGPDAFEPIVVSFDQPLAFDEDNLEGTDQNGSGVRDQNVFLEYADPVMYSAVDRTSTRPGFIAKLHTETNEFEFVGYTNHQEINVGLKSVVLTETHGMIGCSGTSLYKVLYQAPSGDPPVCPMTQKKALSQAVEVKGLTFTRGGELYALETGNGTLVKIDPGTGLVEELGPLAQGLGDFLDLAAGRDNELYGLRVFQPGTPNAVSSVEHIDRTTLACTNVVAGLPGDFTSMDFSQAGHALLFESTQLQWVRLNLSSGTVAEYGPPVTDPDLLPGSRLHFGIRRYELGVHSKLVDNSYHGATVEMQPSGILPAGTWIDLMVRFSYQNVNGGSQHKNHGRDPLGARSAARFKTYDPGPNPVDDIFLEAFLDTAYEETKHDFSHAKASWNVQDNNQAPPFYEHLLAGLGLTGSGELGDFLPIGNAPQIILDTNYQPLPLFDGSTPHILEPTAVYNGEFNFKDIIIPEGVTLVAQGSNPLVLTATGRVEIGGIIDVSGKQGGVDVTFDSAFIPTPGGIGGPSGGRGGMGQPPIPPDFTALSQLQSVPRGERGWGPGNFYQTGGLGGESGAQGPKVPWKGSAPDNNSRGAGGGGGSYAVLGHDGYPGKGQYGVDEDGNFYIRDAYYYWDGSYEWDGTGNWKPGDPYTPKLNEFTLGDDHRHPWHGTPGEPVFADKDKENNFVGPEGELKILQGGQGGGGGGSRLDSMSDDPNGPSFLAPQFNPPLAPSAYDAKGGGGGGGGGAVAIHSLGEIRIKDTGMIIAKGGRGGGGEVIGHCNFGGGGGGGAGGTVILNSGTGIFIEHNLGDQRYGKLDVSGGWGADGKVGVSVTYNEIYEPCEILENNGNLKNAGFCSWARSDGGYGSFGLVQLMVPDPSDPNQLDFVEESVMATLCVIEHEPNYQKTGGTTGFSWYHYWIEGLGPGGSKPFVQHFPKSSDCLVPPEKTKSTIAPQTYAVSKWLDMGRAVQRPPIGGINAPRFEGFEGILPEGQWGMVHTQNGYVVNANIPDWNDIEVDAPDLGKPDYIPETNEVAVQFQATDALVPGSKAPDVDPGVMSDWTWDLASLSGRQFVRFRVKLDVAKGTVLKSDNFKPQVNRLRLRFQF